MHRNPPRRARHKPPVTTPAPRWRSQDGLPAPLVLSPAWRGSSLSAHQSPAVPARPGRCSGMCTSARVPGEGRGPHPKDHCPIITESWSAGWGRGPRFYFKASLHLRVALCVLANGMGGECCVWHLGWVLSRSSLRASALMLKRCAAITGTGGPQRE